MAEVLQQERQQAINDVLAFWFGDSLGADQSYRKPCWFRADSEADRVITQRFGPRLELALAGQLASWGQTPAGALALVIVLDQFPRHIFRHQAKAFAGDDLACHQLKQALQLGFDEDLSALQKSFFYMPLEHSENLENQRHCLQLFEQLLVQAPMSVRATIASNLDFARRHHQLIERFGRFPHRNKVLGRKATAAELDFLAQGGSRFGQ